jgi:hypothetical protein
VHFLNMVDAAAAADQRVTRRRHGVPHSQPPNMHSTLNPGPLIQEPQTLNPNLSILNPNISILNPPT